ncbi:MAG: NAD(+) diphosphatase [Ignavibacteriales bacterium]
MDFFASVAAPEVQPRAAWCFAFRKDELLVIQKEMEKAEIPFMGDLSALNITPVRTQYLGVLNGEHCYSAELPESTQIPEDMAFRNLRSLFGIFDDNLLALSGRAFQIVSWDSTHQFCGRCGTQTFTRIDERAKECPKCGLVNYPRISPAVIVAVVNDGRILLANSGRFKSKMYSVIAGFVEAGETFEECVSREVKEEVNIEVRNIKYFGSQPWPFPNSLMVGFTAEYASGDLKPDGVEILEAGWFSPEALPLIPGRWSIARRLIDWFTDNHHSRQ